MIRLFAGIELPDDIRMRLAGIAGGVPGARWVPLENMHLTLRFIGEVDEATAGDLDAALMQVRGSPFDLVIEGAGSFSHGRFPSMLWAGVAKNEPLVRLQERVESALQRFGLEPEARKFTPHVTLARLRDSPRDRVEAFVAEHALLRLAPFRVRHFTLFSSFLGHEQSSYRAEAEYPLSG